MTYTFYIAIIHPSILIEGMMHLAHAAKEATEQVAAKAPVVSPVILTFELHAAGSPLFPLYAGTKCRVTCARLFYTHAQQLQPHAFIHLDK